MYGLQEFLLRHMTFLSAQVDLLLKTKIYDIWKNKIVAMISNSRYNAKIANNIFCFRFL